MFPKDFTNPDWKGEAIIRDTKVIRFVVMPHVTKAKIDDFMDTLLAMLEQSV